jgi:hypothetical protein
MRWRRVTSNRQLWESWCLTARFVGARDTLHRAVLILGSMALMECGGSVAAESGQRGDATQGGASTSGGTVALGGIGGTTVASASASGGTVASGGIGGTTVASASASAGTGAVSGSATGVASGGNSNVATSQPGVQCSLTVVRVGFVAPPARCHCMRGSGAPHDPPPDGSPAPVDCPLGAGAAVSGVVGPSGGTIILSGTPATAGASVQLDIPSNALSDTVTIRITETTRWEPGGLASWSPVYHFEPDDLIFNSPAIVQIPYVLATDAPDPDLTLFWSNGGTNTCELAPLPGCHVGLGFIQGSVNRLGWALNGVYLPDDPGGCDPPP